MGGSLPQKEGLPKSIQKLSESQAMSISALTWQNDISTLIELLVDIGFSRNETSVVFPNPKGIKETFPLALSDIELEEELLKLKDWNITYAPIPGKAPKQMQEIS